MDIRFMQKEALTEVLGLIFEELFFDVRLASIE